MNARQHQRLAFSCSHLFKAANLTIECQTHALVNLILHISICLKHILLALIAGILGGSADFHAASHIGDLINTRLIGHHFTHMCFRIVDKRLQLESRQTFLGLLDHRLRIRHSVGFKGNLCSFKAFIDCLNLNGIHAGSGHIQRFAELSFLIRIDFQMLADGARPLEEMAAEPPKTRIAPQPVPEAPKAQGLQKLYLRISSEADPRWRHIRLLLSMFPGEGTVLCYFADTKMRRGAACLFHDAMLAELKRVLGEENVVLK